jgi:putative lipoprotein
MIARIALAVSLAAPPPDGWFGADKLKHFFVAAFTQSVTYSALQLARVGHDRALAGAWAVTATVSVAKELRDRRSYGLFSVRDLVWDAAGAGAATLVIQHSVRTSTRPDQPAEAAVTFRAPVIGPLLSVSRPSSILAPSARPILALRR